MIMNKLESLLNKEKSKLNHLDTPDDFESRISHAVKNRHTKRRCFNNKWVIKVAIVMLAVALTGYHIDTLAYYGKKMIGYDNVMSGTLKELNELGKGQMIGKSYTFKSGASITLDGIMLDDNQLLAFYTIQDPNGKVDEIDININDMKGLKSYYKHHGHGEMNDEKTEIKWMMSYETPFFFEKRLTWSFDLWEENRREVGEIKFTLNRNKAMGSSLKKHINKQIKMNEASIDFKFITASPTITSIEGEIQNILELAIDEIKDRRLMPDAIDIRLVADGKELPRISGGMSTNMKGITFHKEFDALPTNLNQLQIKLVSFSANHDIDESVQLKKGENKKTIHILGQNIDINKVYESNGETFVTITTEESVILSKVYLMIDNKSVELENTIEDSLDKKMDGTITHTRTLRFIGTGKDLQLNIKRIKYNTIYNKAIDIPID